MHSVLAVDDSPSIRSLVTYVLEQAGFDVVVAEDGREALDYAQQHTVDLVLTDINMPELDGIDLIKELHMNILVVDYSSAMRMMVVRTLRQAGYGGKDVEQAEDGAVALECIRKKAPDLVLADWNMPNMTGIELLETLRAENVDVTFGFITTESTEEMRQRATDAGAQFLISKPFTVDSFEKVLSTVMS